MKVMLIKAGVLPTAFIEYGDGEASWDSSLAWPDEMRTEFDAADVVIGLFSPSGPLLLKGEAEVATWEERFRTTQRYARLPAVPIDEWETACDDALAIRKGETP